MRTLSTNITLCTSFWKKGTGLMFRKPGKHFAYIFPFSSPRLLNITMAFVFFPIDIIFIKNSKIVEIVRNVRPFSYYAPKKLADTFIEFPKGTIKKSWIGKRVNWNSKIVEIADK